MTTTIPWDSPDLVTPSSDTHLSPNPSQPTLDTVITQIFGTQANNVLIVLEEIGLEELPDTTHLNEHDLRHKVQVEDGYTIKLKPIHIRKLMALRAWF